MNVNGERTVLDGDRSADSASDASTKSAVQPRTPMLCSTCQSLQLGVHRFRVQAPASNQPRSTGRIMRSSATSARLGTLIEIGKRVATCSLCALIVASVDELQQKSCKLADGNEDRQLLRASCFFTWEMDGREGARPHRSESASNTVRGLTRRMHIRWSHPVLSDSYIIYVAPESFSTTASDADRVWDKSSLFLGRKVTQYVENQALVKSWLDLCRKTHQGPCRHQNNLSPWDFHDMVSHSYFGVIDVLNMRLTQLPRTSRDLNLLAAGGQIYKPYLALSYVWGTDSAYTTTTENVMLHRTHGGLENVIQQFPSAIKDAIELVRRLGFQYLWIDRLCIVQDSARSWKLNAYKMDLIYGNAELTICAADGDASDGLRAMKPENHNLQQCRAEVMPGLNLMVTRPPETYIRQSTWNERAWTFQERLLSRRCLIFTNGRVYFQCRSTGMSEEIYADRKGAGWSLDLVHAPMQMFRQIDTCAIWVYMRSVELYTERRLTKSQDILAAFSGVSNILKSRLRAPFIHGLPSSHFDLALLWEPTQALERRMIAESAEKKSYSIPDFPSWSWAGWTGPVAFQDHIVGSLLDDVSEWINTRTWIKWWVRDGHGDLRPLWDSERSKIDRSTDCRWRGYQKSGKRADRMRRNSPEGDERYHPEFMHPAVIGEDEDQGQKKKPYPVLDPEINWARRKPQSSYSSEESLPEQTARSVSPESYQHSQDDKRLRRQNNSDSSDSAVTIRVPTRRVRRLRENNRRPSPQKWEDPKEYGPMEYDPNVYDPKGYESKRYEPNRYENYRSRLPRPRSHIPRSDFPPIYPEPVHPETTHNSGFFDMVFGNRREDFSITLKDYPYRVVKAPFTSKLESFEFPLLPILQFRTWHTVLYVEAAVAPSAEKVEAPRTPRDEIGAGQVRCHIADDAGDWVGSIVLGAQWATRQTTRQHEFIAISEAKNFTEAECDTWTYYIPKERKESEWDLFYVLLIERKDEKWERVGLGKVFKEAFRDARWKEIMLG
ncbi:heterokaryon incompatibility protein [Xylaria palmicola]|nr:heterokaryon incompatibility protein [Xylaria palmicola]